MWNDALVSKHPKDIWNLVSVTRAPSFTWVSDVLWKLKPSLIVTSESIIHLGKQTTFQGPKYNLITKSKSWGSNVSEWKWILKIRKKNQQQPENKTACPRCIVWMISLVLICFFCGCLQCVLEHLDCYSACVSVGVIRKDILLPGVIDGGTVSDSPHTGLVLIISSKILPTTALGMAGHAAISSCDQWGQVRADLEAGASAGVHFLNVQLYGLPRTNGHRLLSVMQFETLIWAWVKAQTPRSTLSRWSDAESSSSILRSSENKRPIMADILKERKKMFPLRQFCCVYLPNRHLESHTHDQGVQVIKDADHWAGRASNPSLPPHLVKRKTAIKALLRWKHRLRKVSAL